jgi:hypothetical protein
MPPIAIGWAKYMSVLFIKAFESPNKSNNFHQLGIDFVWRSQKLLSDHSGFFLRRVIVNRFHLTTVKACCTGMIHIGYKSQHTEGLISQSAHLSHTQMAVARFGP